VSSTLRRGGPLDSLILSPTAQRLLTAGAIVFAIAVVALFFSFIQGPLLELLGEVRSRAQHFRTGMLEKSGSYLRDKSETFWRERELEPRAPVAAELQRLTYAVESVGMRQVEAITGAERRMTAHLQTLRSIHLPEGVQSATDRERIIESVGGTSIFGLAFLVAFAVAIGGVNSFLLGIFFREVIGSYRILPYPMPDVQASNLIAVIIFFAEVATGWGIYRSGERLHRAAAASEPGVRPAGAGFFKATPWIMLFVLAVVELAAYSTLSVHVNLADRLHVAAGSLMYGPAQYFLSFLGIGLTLLLAYLGHAIAEGLDDRRRSRLSRDLVNAFRRGKTSALEQANRLRELVDGIRRVTADFPQSISGEFARELGIDEHRERVLATVERCATEMSVRAVRSRPQAWGDLFVSAFLAITLLLVAALTTFEIVDLLRETGSLANELVAWGAGIATSMSMIGLGALAWSLFRGLRYASPASAALPERRGRRVLGWMVAGVTLAASTVLVAAAIAESRGQVPYVYGALAVLQAGVLICFAGFADRGAVALLQLAYLGWLSIVRLSALVLAGLASVVDAVGFAIRVLVRLVAIPGDLLRGRLTSRATAT
jgi:hypothetical protein